jgi:DHA1 family multidrug resistance protein-like MFS transporter
MSVAGFGTGLLQAGVISTGSLRVSPAEQGAAAGWLTSAPAAGFLIGPTLSATLYTLHHSLPFAAVVAVMTVLALSAWQIRVAAHASPTDKTVHGEA